MPRTSGFYLAGTASDALNAMPVEFVVIDAANDKRAATIPFTIAENIFSIDAPQSVTATWPAQCKFQLEINIESITGNKGEKKIKHVTDNGKNIFINNGIDITGSYLTKPANGSTLSGSTLDIEIKHDAPAGRAADIHLSSKPQPTSDTDSKGNDLGDSSGLGTGTSYRFEVPQNGAKIYGRIYYSDNNWANAKTLIADGCYTDFELVQNKAEDAPSGNTSGLTQLVIPNNDISEKDYALSHWESMVGPNRDFWENNDFNHCMSVVNKDGRRALKVRLSPFPGRDNKPSTRAVGGIRIKNAPKIYTVSNQLLVESPFSWGGSKKTGKLGLGIAGKVNDKTPPSGGKPVKDGFSERIIFDKDGQLKAYHYNAKTKGYGDRTDLDFTMPLDEWVEIAIEITINSKANAADGRSRIFINGDLVMDKKGVTFFGKGQPVISRVWLQASMGGNNSKYAPNGNNHVYFSNLYHGPGTYQ